MNQTKNQIKYLVNKGSQFYERSMKSWLGQNDIEMHQSYGKSVTAERFIRALKK